MSSSDQPCLEEFAQMRARRDSGEGDPIEGLSVKRLRDDSARDSLCDSRQGCRRRRAA